MTQLSAKLPTRSFWVLHMWLLLYLKTWKESFPLNQNSAQLEDVLAAHEHLSARSNFLLNISGEELLQPAWQILRHLCNMWWKQVAGIDRMDVTMTGETSAPLPFWPPNSWPYKIKFFPWSPNNQSTCVWICDKAMLFKKLRQKGGEGMGEHPSRWKKKTLHNSLEESVSFHKTLWTEEK